MTERLDGFVPPIPDSYSPEKRTALVLVGTGTAGAYHAGVLRALQEAGVKLDVVAGRGVGVVGALFAAVDGGHRLWDEKGLWRAPGVGTFYRWRWVVRLVIGAVALAALVVLLPLAAVAAGAIVYPLDFLVKMVGGGGAAGLTGGYVQLAEAAFAPTALPTWLPRLAVLILGVAALLSVAAGWWGSRGRRRRGPFWWRALRAPLSASEITEQCWRTLWDFVRGAAQLKQPTSRDLAHRYLELLAENIGQPGFRELVITVHDLDARRDLVFALVSEARRRDLVRRPTSAEAEVRRAEVLDLAGVGRDLLVDAVAGALASPIVTEPHPVTFTPDAYWRGETHRLSDRPSALLRLMNELVALGVEQAIVVSAAASVAGPHALSAPPLDGRGRVGEAIQSAEAAIVRDAVVAAAASGGPRVFLIQPGHNPFGPFDMAGAFDDRSDRPMALGELTSRAYEDAYHQFIEPVVGASGEHVGLSHQ